MNQQDYMFQPVIINATSGCYLLQVIFESAVVMGKRNIDAVPSPMLQRYARNLSTNGRTDQKPGRSEARCYSINYLPRQLPLQPIKDDGRDKYVLNS